MSRLFQAMLLGPWILMIGNRKMCNLSAKPNAEDLVFVKELLEAKNKQERIQEKEQHIVFAVSLLLGNADKEAGSRMIEEFCLVRVMIRNVVI